MKEKEYQISFLINPISGGGLGGTVYKHLPEIMASFGFEASSWVSVLTKKDSMVQQAKELLKKSKKIIAVGGDGTMGLILNELGRQEYSTEIGLIPLGTGNDLGRAIGIYHVYQQRGLLSCLKRLIRAGAVVFDLWSLNGQKVMAAYFSMGLDGSVLHDFDQARKKEQIAKGVFYNKCYYLKKLWGRRHYKIHSDAELELHSEGLSQTVSLKGAVCCLIGNINSYAGGAAPFLNSQFNDGILDVIIFRNFWSYFWLSTLSRKNTRLARWLGRGVECYSAQSIKIRDIGAEFCQLDGEDITGDFSQGSVELSLVQKAQLLDLRSPPFEVF